MLSADRALSYLAAPGPVLPSSSKRFAGYVPAAELNGRLVVAASALAVEGWRVLTPTPALRAGTRVVEIPPHSRLRDIAHRLQHEGVIRSPAGFAVLGIVMGQARRLKAGERRRLAQARVIE